MKKWLVSWIFFAFFFAPFLASSATILTTNSSDTMNTFRTNVNTSLTNLNNALFTWPWTVTTNFGASVNSTSTPTWYTAGVQASSTSQLTNASIWGNLTLKATSSRLLATDDAGNIIGTSTINTSLLIAPTNAILAGDSLGVITASSSIGWNLIKGPASSIFGFNETGNPIATTSINTAYITGPLGTINGSAFNRGGSITISSVWPWTTATTFGTSTNATTTPTWYKTGVFASSTSQFDYASTTALTVSGRIFTGDGANTAPAYSFASDPDTGVFNSGSNVLSFASAGTECWALSSSGLRGIGNAACSELHAGGSGSASNPTITFNIDSDTGLFANNDNFVGFTTGGIEAARIDASQRLGIATSTPFWNLTVAASTTPQLALMDATKTSDAWTLRNIANTLYIATSTPTATSTTAALTIDPNGLLTFRAASSTTLSAATICLTADSCKTAWPSAGGVWPFTIGLTNFGTSTQATTTAEWFKMGMHASSTSQLENLNVWNALRLTATSSALLSTDQNGYVVSTSTINANLLSTVPIAKGGTGATSLGSHMIVAMNGSSLVSTSTPTAARYIATSTTQRSIFPIASTTALSVSNNMVSGERYPVFTYATTTTWTGTTTLQLIAPFNYGIFRDMQCSTATSSTDTTGTYTLNVQFVIAGTNVTPMFNASTTKGTVTFSGNTAFSRGSIIEAQFGTPANTPLQITCTGRATGF